MKSMREGWKKKKDIDRESSKKYRDEERLIKILYNEEN